MAESPKKIVLAYSGGLDTSVILPWLKERYPGTQVVAYAAELGQGDELSGVEAKARESGADEVVVEDLRDTFAEQFCFPMLRARPVYESDYLLGTSVARPLIAARQAETARATGADALAHGATGKGNDQVRFELTYQAVAPEMAIISPWKDPAFELTSREAAIRYAHAHGVPVEQTEANIYSRDRNLWHISHEGGEIEDPAQAPPDACLTISVPATAAPDEPRDVAVGFRDGVPASVDGAELGPAALIERLNELGGGHGVGQAVLVENRLVGMKSRGVYETPGGTILYEAAKALEQLCLERETMHYKEQLAVKYAELVYNGQWFHPLRHALQAFVDHATGRLTGTATVRLYKGRAQAVAAESPESLYDPQLASFAMDGYDVTAARGFIDLFGLPTKVWAMRHGSDAAAERRA